jgi:ArsR family transcriptional regulator, cadmium/lead-responsive transcriptional repressor
LLIPTNAIPLKARLFRALSDEPRLAVLEQLSQGERRVSDLAVDVGLSQSAVSTHLASLHAAGAVERRSEGRSVYYAFAHPSVETLLSAAEEVICAPLQNAYACVQECCVVAETAAGESP